MFRQARFTFQYPYHFSAINITRGHHKRKPMAPLLLVVITWTLRQAKIKIDISSSKVSAIYYTKDFKMLSRAQVWIRWDTIGMNTPSSVDVARKPE